MIQAISYDCSGWAINRREWGVQLRLPPLQPGMSKVKGQWRLSSKVNDVLGQRSMTYKVKGQWCIRSKVNGVLGQRSMTPKIIEVRGQWHQRLNIVFVNVIRGPWSNIWGQGSIMPKFEGQTSNTNEVEGQLCLWSKVNEIWGQKSVMFEVNDISIRGILHLRLDIKDIRG